MSDYKPIKRRAATIKASKDNYEMYKFLKSNNIGEFNSYKKLIRFSAADLPIIKEAMLRDVHGVCDNDIENPHIMMYSKTPKCLYFSDFVNYYRQQVNPRPELNQKIKQKEIPAEPESEIEI